MFVLNELIFSNKNIVFAVKKKHHSAQLFELSTIFSNSADKKFMFRDSDYYKKDMVV